MTLKGRVWKFGDNISTDHIVPGRLMHLRSNLPELAKHVLEDADPDFAKKVAAGDFVVGGRNFGLGSSREHAPTVIKLAGVSAVLAKSFARIFFRNAINMGLPPIVCDTDKIDQGNFVEVDLKAGWIKDIDKKLELTFQPLPKIMENILNDGGLLAHIQKHGDFKLD